MKHILYDALVAGGTTVLLSHFWSQWASPFLQSLALVLGVVFLALGVALRWRAYRTGKRYAGDDAEC